MDGNLTKFAGGNKLQGLLTMFKDRAAIQRHAGKLEEGAKNNLMKYNRDKYQALCWGKKSPLQHYRLGPECWGIRSLEKCLGGLADSRLNRRQQHALAAPMANSIFSYYQQGNSRQIEGSAYLSKFSTRQMVSGILYYFLGSHQKKKRSLTSGAISSETTKVVRVWSTCPVTTG